MVDRTEKDGRDDTWSKQYIAYVHFVVRQKFQRIRKDRFFYLNSQHQTWGQPVRYLLRVRPFTDLAQQSVGQIQVELVRPFFCQRLCETGAGQKLKQRQNQDGTEPRTEFGVFGYQTQCCKTDERKLWGGCENIQSTPLSKRGAMDPNICFGPLSHRRNLGWPGWIFLSVVMETWHSASGARVGIRVKTNMLKAGQWIFAYQHVWKQPDMLPNLAGPRAQSKVRKDMLRLTLPSAPSGPRTHQGYLDLINALQMDGRSRSSQKHFYLDRGAGSVGPVESRGGARPHPSTTHPLADPKKEQSAGGHLLLGFGEGDLCSVCNISRRGSEAGAAALSRGEVDNLLLWPGSDGRHTAAATAARLSPSSSAPPRPEEESEAEQPQIHTAPTPPPCCPPAGRNNSFIPTTRHLLSHAWLKFESLIQSAT